MRRAARSGIAGVCLVLGGCVSGVPSPWEQHYEQRAGVSLDDVSGVAMVQVDYSILAERPEVRGYDIVGVSTFRSEVLDERETGEGSPLIALAKEHGADLVRWGVHEAGTETKTVYVRSHSVGYGSRPGKMGSDPISPEPEMIPVTRTVPVFDYIAVLYASHE